jgi:ferredoxin--NADP+ reductase
MSLSVAVVGSGPGGMYIVQALLERAPGCRIDVIERLPSPFGLIRGGVAPDHATTKNVARAFEKTLQKDGVRYLGNVEVGKDISVAELEAIYDAVVLAYGAPFDNRLGVPGEDKKGVIGSNAFVGWYNCHPDFLDLDPPLDVQAVAVVGVGNVAIDVARVLAKTPAEMAATDIAPYAAERIRNAPIRDIYMFGRRGPVEAAFTNVELREMGHLANCAPVIDPAQLPAEVAPDGMSDRDFRLKQKNLETMRGFPAVARDGKAKRIHFVFYASPVAVLGGERVEAIRLERTRVEGGRAVGTGETFDVPCGLVVTCIGSRAEPIDGVPFDARKGIVLNDRGRVRPGLYAAGWVKRGASGTIGTNKTDADDVADLLVAEVRPSAKPGPGGLDAALKSRGVRAVSFADWQVISRLEVERASKPAPRLKFVTPDEMIAALERARAGA